MNKYNISKPDDRNKIIDLSSKFKEKQMENIDISDVVLNIKETNLIVKDLYDSIKKEFLTTKDESIEEQLLISEKHVDNYRKENQILKNKNINLKIKEKEAELEMKKIKDIYKEHIEFLLVSFFTIIFSIIGLLVFSIKGLYIIHPSIYILGIFMGIGWGATALTSLFMIRRKK